MTDATLSAIVADAKAVGNDPRKAMALHKGTVKVYGRLHGQATVQAATTVYALEAAGLLFAGSATKPGGWAKAADYATEYRGVGASQVTVWRYAGRLMCKFGFAPDSREVQRYITKANKRTEVTKAITAKGATKASITKAINAFYDASGAYVAKPRPTAQTPGGRKAAQAPKVAKVTPEREASDAITTLARCLPRITKQEDYDRLVSRLAEACTKAARKRADRQAKADATAHEAASAATGTEG